MQTDRQLLALGDTEMRTKPWIGGVGQMPFRARYYWTLGLRCEHRAIESHTRYSRPDSAIRGLRRALRRLGIDLEQVEIES